MDSIFIGDLENAAVLAALFNNAVGLGHPSTTIQQAAEALEQNSTVSFISSDREVITVNLSDDGDYLDVRRNRNFGWDKAEQIVANLRSTGSIEKIPSEG